MKISFYTFQTFFPVPQWSRLFFYLFLILTFFFSTLFPFKNAFGEMKKLSDSTVTYCTPRASVPESELSLLFVGEVASSTPRIRDLNYTLTVYAKEWYVQNASSTAFYLITPETNIVVGQRYAFYTNVPYSDRFEWQSSCMYPREITPTLKATLVNPLVAYDYFAFGKNLGTGMTDSDVVELQKYLNNNGYTVSNEGLGSKGNENTYFGTKTRAAVALFQKDHAEAIGIRVATGFFGDKTREYVNSLRHQDILNQEICSVSRVLVDPNEFKDRRGIDGSFVGYVKKNGQYFSINGYVLDAAIPLDPYVGRLVSVVGKLRQYYVGEKYFEEIQPQKIVCERIPVVLSVPEPGSANPAATIASSTPTTPVESSGGTPTPPASPETPSPSLIPLGN